MERLLIHEWRFSDVFPVFIFPFRSGICVNEIKAVGIAGVHEIKAVGIVIIKLIIYSI